MSSDLNQSARIVVIGDGGVGKTCLLLSFKDNAIPGIGEYVPTALDTYTTSISVDEEMVILNLWDTAGQSDKLRTLTYSLPTYCNVVIVCFSIAEPDSLDNISDKWIPELKHHCPNVPFLLVGTKKDLRDSQDTIRELRKKNKQPVTYAQGVSKSRSVSASCYLETSALLNDGVKDVFKEATREAMRKQKKSREGKKGQRKCLLL